jgi:hypothetical protein
MNGCNAQARGPALAALVTLIALSVAELQRLPL